MVHSQIGNSQTGNCLPQENVSILHVSSSEKRTSKDIINNTVQRCHLLHLEAQGLPSSSGTDHDYCPDPTALSEFSKQVVAYIAGYAVFRLEQKIKCDLCASILISDGGNKMFCFVKTKSRGRLVFALEDVATICKTSKSSGLLPNKANRQMFIENFQLKRW